MLDPSIMVIFGITGDLAKRYLLPALYHLCKDDLLPEHTVIVGTSRQVLVLDEFLGQVELCVLEQDNVCDPEVLKRLRSMMELVQLDPVQESDYATLRSRLEAIEEERGLCLNRLYYLSIPPQLYSPVVQHLGSSGLNGSCQHGKALTRLLVEKPFGYDEQSARELIEHTATIFSEEQVFRIDHYLAKETVQHILLFRQRNPQFESLWNGQHVQSIEIAAYESLGIESRKFYDQIGGLRDLVQSHLWQLLGLVTMELPKELTSQSIHGNKETMLESIGALPADKVALDTIRGQYEGYKEEVSNNDSTTETFAALSFQLPTSRWQGTDILLSTGKALSEKSTSICLKFNNGSSVEFRIQPNPQIKTTGDMLAVTDFSDIDTPLNHAQPDAYERVLIDAVRGDHTLFASAPEILASWHSLQPVLDEWAKGSPPLVTYKQGSSADQLVSFQ